MRVNPRLNSRASSRHSICRGNAIFFAKASSGRYVSHSPRDIPEKGYREPARVLVCNISGHAIHSGRGNSNGLPLRPRNLSNMAIFVERSSSSAHSSSSSSCPVSRANSASSRLVIGSVRTTSTMMYDLICLPLSDGILTRRESRNLAI